ncbi:MAG: hypothetical protein AB7H43_08035, partial [Acidimicrobiia bacterium]
DADARPDLQWWGTETRRRGKKLLLPETGLWRAPWPDAPSNAGRLGRGGNDNPAWYPLLVDELRNWVDVLALWSIFEHDPDTHHSLHWFPNADAAFKAMLAANPSTP